MVGTDAGSTRDMPMHVVHDEGERQDMDKGGYARQGMYAESLRVDVLGFWGGVTVDEGCPWQGEGSGKANMIGKPFALCKVCAHITLLKRYPTAPSSSPTSPSCSPTLPPPITRLSAQPPTPIRPFVHSPSHPLPFAHSFVHPATHSHSPIRSFTQPPTPVRPFIHSPSHPPRL